MEAFSVFSRPQTPYRPKLAIITCNKRHHVRFYPIDDDSAGSSGNPPPGTVVDRGITAVYDFDFFLRCSQLIYGCDPSVDICDSTRCGARHCPPNPLLCHPRWDWVQGGRSPETDKLSLLYVCPRDQGCEPGIPCLLCGGCLPTWKMLSAQAILRAP